MKRVALLASLLMAVALFASGSGSALADGGKGVKVKPLQPKPGDVITVQGDLLGPNSTVEVRVIGPGGVNIDLGEVQANDEGDFTAQFTLPANLAVGTYQVQAKGAESATTEITVRGAPAGGGDAGDAQTAEAPVLRSRPRGESIALVVLFGLLAGLGIFFAQTAHRETQAS